MTTITVRSYDTARSQRQRMYALHQRTANRGRWVNLPNLLALAAIILTVGAIISLRQDRVNTFGLLFAGPAGVLTLAAALTAVVATLLAVSLRKFVAGWIGLGALIAAFRLPTVFASGYPMYGWTYKHLGVIDYIQTNHNLDTNVDIYFSWPGMFTAGAWFANLTGVSMLTVATWFILAIHVAQALAVYALARSLARTKYQALTAALVAEALNWIAQDYFSPQALGFVLAMLTLTVLFNSRRYPALAWVSLPMFAGLVVTHQLTPYWMCIVVFFACIFGYVRPRYLFVFYGLICLGWTVLNLHALARYGLFSGFNPVGNAVRPNFGVYSAGRVLTETAMKAIAAGTWLLAAATAVVYFVRHRRQRLVLAIMPFVLTFSSFILLGGQNYGGEAIFRVLLYSLPGAAILIGTALATLLRWRPNRRWLSTARLACLLLPALLISTVSLQAQYGTWFANIVDKSSYVVANEELVSLPAGAYTLGMVPVGPGRATANYVNFATANPSYDFSLPGLDDKLVGQTFNNPKVIDNLTARLQALGAPVTLTWTTQMENYSDYYGIFPHGALNRLVSQLRADTKNWTVIVDHDDIVVFELKGSL